MEKGWKALTSQRTPKLTKARLLLFVQLRQLLSQALELRHVVVDDVGFVRMIGQVILMIAFSFVKSFQGRHLGHDLLRKDFRLVQLRDVAFRDAFLLVVRVKDCRAILRAAVWSLTIQFRRVVRDCKEDFEQLAVSDLRRIVGNVHRLGMSGLAGTYFPVVRVGGWTADVTRLDARHAFDMFEDCFNAPETTAGQHGSLLAFRFRERRVNGGIGNGTGFVRGYFGNAARTHSSNKGSQNKKSRKLK